MNSSKFFFKNIVIQTIYTILYLGKTTGLISKLAELEIKLGYEVQTYKTG